MESLRHLLILCCYGGVPFIEFMSNETHEPLSHTLDPTDWIAVDSSGSLLNATIHPDLLASDPSLQSLIPTDADIPLERCDLFNLTFSSAADQNLYELGHGALSCRCPRSRNGRSCHLLSPPEVSAQIAMESENPFGFVLLCFLCLVLAMTALFAMVRGCFCDCFGGFRNPFGSSEPPNPVDQNALNRCMEAVRNYEKSRESQYPLINSVSESCSPYDPPVFSKRNCSPPPSYRSERGSFETIPISQTKL